MASTNKTTHYDLSQYIASDKPTYLTDYNGDMSAIDTGMYNAQTKADSAYTLAGTADGKADTGITNAGLAQTDASTALTRIGTMANLETTEKTSLVGAINEIIGKFDLSNVTHITSDNITNGSGDVYVAVNSDGTLAKIYGSATSVDANSGVLSFSTSLRPTSDITIVGGVVRVFNEYNNYDPQYIVVGDYTIKTNGDVEINYGPLNQNTYNNRFILINSLIFVKDFGDTPVPEPNA